MKIKKKIITVSALVIIGVLGLVAVNSVSAYRGDVTVKGPNYTVERHDAMEKAFETNDFTVWRKLMEGRGHVTQVITKDNFAKFEEAHNLDEQGKTSEALAIRKELGLGLRDGSGQNVGLGLGHGMGHGRMIK